MLAVAARTEERGEWVGGVQTEWCRVDSVHEEHDTCYRLSCHVEFPLFLLTHYLLAPLLTVCQSVPVSQSHSDTVIGCTSQWTQPAEG